MSTKFGLQIDFDLRKRVTSSNTNPEVVLSHRWCHLEIVYDVITPERVARFGRNLVAWCGIARRLLWYGPSNNRKKCQYDGRLFFQTGNTYKSDVDWAITTKFGLSIDIDLLKWVTSTNPKPEVKLRVSVLHLENRSNIITPPKMVRFGGNSTAWCRMTSTVIWTKLKPEVEF